jgi:acyl-CoA synthetase (AMP-forming)/AMP-acid ligase II
VVGVPDGRWGQVVCAVVVTDRTLTTEGVRAWLLGRIADDKRPRRVFRVADLPATGTGKVARSRLRGILADAEELPSR